MAIDTADTSELGRPDSGTNVYVAATSEGRVFLGLVGAEHGVQVEMSPEHAVALAWSLMDQANDARRIVEGG